MGPWGERLEPGKPREATPESGFMLALRTSPRAGQMRVRGHWSAHVGEPGWPGRGRGRAGGVRWHLREGCSLSGNRGPPVLLHFILLVKNLRYRLDLADRTGYIPRRADGIWRSDGMGLVL